MSYLNCPICGLSVPRTPAVDVAQLDECPRCLTRSGGSMSVKLTARRAGAREHDGQRSIGGLLAQLRPTAIKR